MWQTAPVTTLLFGKEAPTRLYAEGSGVDDVEVDARSVCDFYYTTYGGCQAVQRPSVRQILVQYYKEQFQRILLDSDLQTRNTIKKEKGEEMLHDPVLPIRVKEGKEDEEGARQSGGFMQDPRGEEGAAAASARVNPVHVEENASMGLRADRQLRFKGILTKVHHGSTADDVVVPWELHVIHHPEDEREYSRALAALSAGNQHDKVLNRNRKEEGAILLDLVSAGEVSGRTSYDGNVTNRGSPMFHSLHGEEEEGEEEQEQEPDGRCLALYTRLMSSFTGVYPGMAIGVVGEPCGRSKTGVLTSLLVHELVMPQPPLLPWLPRTTDGLLSVSSSSFATPVGHTIPAGQIHDVGSTGVRETTSSLVVGKPKASPSTPARVHYCCGPYPRHRQEVMALLYQVLQQALKRGADLLIIGGPFIPEAAMAAESVAALSVNTFSEYVEGYAIFLEDELAQYYSTHRSSRRFRDLKVVFLPHRSDVTQVPVLPTVMFSVPDDTHVLMRSNPCRISVNGVHIGICNDDVISKMQTRMVERWPVAQQHLRRVVETIIQSRTFLPVFQFPMPELDLKHWNRLRLDCLPSGDGTAKGRTHWSDEEEDKSRSWNWIMQTVDRCYPPERSTPETITMKVERESDDEESHPPPTGKFKTELIGDDDHKRNLFRVHSSSTKSDASLRSYAAATAIRNKVEYMPHILLLPSSRPAFAVVTHRGIVDPQHPDLVVPESGVEDTIQTSGVLVVNQEVWSTRSPGRYALRVAEISMYDTASVMENGVSPANTSCELLHVYDVPAS